MDFLNNTISQIRDLFNSMPPGSRLTAGMLLVMIVISLIYLLGFQSSKADRYLFGSREFSDKDIATMQQAFSAENLDDYMLEGKRIRVPRGKLNQYMQALDKAGFAPADIEADIEEIRDRGSSILASEKEKEFWRGQAQQQKLARAIAKRPEIDWATVQYREVKMGGFPPTIERKATVVASGANNRPIDRATARTIRTTAAFWFGIQPEDVAVNDVNGITYVDGEEMDGLGKEARMYAEAKRHYETYYRDKIERCLSIFPGVVATVNVEMDPTIYNESTKVSLDPQPVAIESETFTKTSETKPANGGRPGAVPNEVTQANEPRTLSTIASQETKSDENREQQVSLAGHEQTRERKAALRPKVVTATVSIPRSYFYDVWHQKNPPKEGEDPQDPPVSEIDKIEAKIIKQIEDKVVKTIPPLDAGENPFPQVEVSSYDDLTVEAPPAPSMAKTTLAWFSENWQTIGLFVVGLVSLFVLRSMVRSAAPTTAPAPSEALPEIAASEEEEEPEEETAAILHRRTTSSGSTLREELTAMVREDPDAAANVLRTWIGDAA